MDLVLRASGANTHEAGLWDLWKLLTTFPRPSPDNSEVHARWVRTFLEQSQPFNGGREEETYETKGNRGTNRE